MELGRHLHELWRMRRAVVVCVLGALFAALWAGYKISLLPPGLKARSLQIAAARTEVLVDTPRSALADLRQDLFAFESMKNRAVLLGNVMASPPVIAYIARRAGVPSAAVRAQTPRTPNTPRLSTPATERHTSDLLRSTDEYRLSIEANPTVPVLTVYAQAPDGATAGALANASVDGLRDYLEQEARARGIRLDQQVRLRQLGRAHGEVINAGASAQAMVLVFLVVLVLSSAAAAFFMRVRRGWELARQQEQSCDARATGLHDEIRGREDADAAPANRGGRERQLAGR